MYITISMDIINIYTEIINCLILCLAPPNINSWLRHWGTRFPVTPQLVADVLWIPRVEFPNYPSCECLRTVSKDELMSAFCERPSNWGDRQFTQFKPFAKDPRFLNMVMTFVLHPLSYYNSITEFRALFLLSLLEHLTIDFLSHFHSFHYRCSSGFGIPW